VTSPVHHAVTVPATTANLGPGFDAYGLALRDPRVGTGPDRGVASLVVRSLPRAEVADRVVCAGEGAREVAAGDDNLIWSSFVAFCEAHDVTVPDVALRVDNAIPLERGLGSSSAAIVAGLTLARALTTDTVDRPVGDLDVVRLADRLEGHPDNVAPAVLGGLVACATDAQGELVVRRVDPGPTLRPVVLVPTTRQATTSARGVLPETVTRQDASLQAARAGHVLAALVGVWPADVGATVDLLHEPARAAAMPITGALIDRLREAGVHAWLSGAGPSVAAVLDGPGSDRARTVADIAGAAGFAVHHLEVDLAGALPCPDGGCGLSGVGDCVRCPRRRV
jgi:homoserine kinase